MLTWVNHGQNSVGIKNLKNGRVKLEIDEDMIATKSCKLPDITEFFDRIEADITSDLSDWKAVRRELLETCCIRLGVKRITSPTDKP